MALAVVTRRTDGNGKVTVFRFDGLDRLVQEIRKEGDTDAVADASDAVTRHSYDANGNELSMTEPNGNRTRYVYDRLNRRRVETNAAGDVTRTTFDAVGNVLSITAPNLNVTTFTYDEADRLLQTEDLIGLVRRATYDADDNMISEADGNGHTTTFGFDALHRLTTRTDPLGQPAEFEYDAVGNLTRAVDRLGQVVTHAYDDINRRVTSREEGAPGLLAVTRVTAFAYDAVGNLIRITDPNLNATTYAYDPVNRRTVETYADPPPNSRSFSYDLVGNLLTRTDQRGQTTTYSYNDLYFLMGRDYSTGADDAFSYDLSGRLRTADRAGWLVTFAYDGANRVVSTVQNGRTIRHDVRGRKQHRLPGRAGAHTRDGRTPANHAADRSGRHGCRLHL